MPADLFDSKQLRDRFKIVFLVGLVIAIYLPGLNSGFFIFDDFGIVESLRGKGLHEALGFFTHTDGRYWRPIILTSFLFDVSLTNAHSSWMHLHNVLLHAANTVLVFLIVRLVASRREPRHEWPLLASALFAVHPVNTEAVNWIAGRTDILAALFSLAAVYCFLLSIQSRKVLFSWGAALLVLAGCLAKEVAFPLFPAMLLSVLLVKEWPFASLPRLSAANAAVRGLPFLVGGCAYLWLRGQAFVSIDQGVGKIVQNSTSNVPLITEQVHTGLTALGFYLKKLLIPYPLNFAIDHVSSLYFILGIVTLLACCFLASKRSIVSALLLFMLLTIAPAILNAIFHIAWTPYAERYLYLPAAFLCAGLCCGVAPDLAASRTRILLIALCFLCFLGLTAQRNLQWREQAHILADAIRQNPGNSSLRINHALVLAGTVGPADGREALHRVLALEPNNQAALNNLAILSLQLENNPEQAREDLKLFFYGTLEPDTATLSTMLRINEKRLELASPGMISAINHELFLSHLKYHLLTGDPAHLFAAAAKAATFDEQESARRLLKKLLENPSTVETLRSRAETVLAAFSRPRESAVAP